MTTTKLVSSRSRTRRNRQRLGTAVVELLSLTAVIAILIGHVLPMLQAAREEANRAQCLVNVQWFATAMDAYHKKTGRFPATGGEALVVADWPFSMAKDGYMVSNYAARADGWSMTFNPLPGITGSETIHVNAVVGGWKVTSVPTPGADEARARMFAAVRTRGAELFQQLTSHLKSSERAGFFKQVRAYVRTPGVAQDVIASMQYVNNKKIGYPSVAAALNQHAGHTGDLADIVISFWRAASRDMQFGAYGEGHYEVSYAGVRELEVWTTPGKIAPYSDSGAGLEGQPPGSGEFFSYGTLSDVTFELVPVAKTAQALQTWLVSAWQRAVAGDRSGEQAAMKAYVRDVDLATTGRRPSVSPIAAEVLKTMSFVFIEALN
jgi:Tfp pilus assembly protein PilE